MRVVYFTESLYPLVDGVSRTLARLFATLERRGVDFRVYSPFVPAADVPWRGRVRPTRYIHFPPYPDYRVSLPVLGRIEEEVRAFSPHLIHVVSPTPLAYRAQSLARQLGVPVVASFHTHFVSYFRYYGVRRLEPVGWWLLRRFYAGCDRVFVPSESIIGELREKGIDRLELWSRGIDLSGFSPARRDGVMRKAFNVPDGQPVLLLVSRLVKEKDLADLVEVNRLLRERGVPFTFVLVGDGPMRGTLELALPDATFLGHLAGEDLARAYASADVFIFPSTTETLGNVVLEALASGLPAVVVDRGGPQDLITPGSNGFVARSNDPVDMADKLQLLLRDPALRLRMGENARLSAGSRDWEEINDGLLAAYRRVVQEWREDLLEG